MRKIRNVGTRLMVCSLIASIAVASLGCQRYERAGMQYTGPELSGETLVCRSDEIAAAGFWRDLQSGQVEKASRVSTEPRATTWRITLKQASADVISFSGAFEGINEPATFGVEHTPSGGLLLISQSRLTGDGTEVITIDQMNSSFVYVSQHVNQL